jgi:cation:H+ antiporter
MEHLINPAWFESLPTIVLILIGAASMFFVIKGADFLVEGASGIALRAGISKVIVGATIVSLGTTSPECAVSVFAAFKGNAGLALGNAVGSIIADTALIFGVGCMLATLPVDKFLLNRQGWVQFGVISLLAVICYTLFAFQGDSAQIGRIIGLVLILLLVGYIAMSVQWGRQHSMTGIDRAHHEPDEVMDHASRDSWLKLLVMFIGGLALVVVFAQLLITNVEIVAARWGVPQVVIAATIVAFGTSLPELVVGITAIRKGHPALLIGNVIGADILNVLFVVGAAALAKPLPIVDPNPESTMSHIFLVLHLPVMLLVTVMFRGYIFAAVKRGQFSRWMGAPLVVIYIGYLIANVFLGR